MSTCSFATRAITGTSERSRSAMRVHQGRTGFVSDLLAARALSLRALIAYARGRRHPGRSAFTDAEHRLISLSIAHAGAGRISEEHEAGLAPNIIAAVHEDRPILDPKLAAIHDFTTKMARTHAWVSRDDVNDFIVAGHTHDQVLDIVLAITAQDTNTDI